MDYIIDVPEPFGLSLFDDDLAGVPLRDRSSGSVGQAVIEVLGVAANTTSIVVAVAAFPDIARRLLKWIRGGDVQRNGQPPTAIRISTPDGLIVDVRIPQGADGGALDLTVAEVSSALERAASGQVT
jgi:hypothetical protein